MNRSMWKTTLREIKNSLGRYLAIFAIIGLGVGFFSGLRVTRDAMVEATDRFVSDHSMFDLRLISTLGFTNAEIEILKSADGIDDAYGAYKVDALVNDVNKEYVASFNSIDYSINTPSLTYGRMPEKSGEILADARLYPKELVGGTVTVSLNNKSETLNCFSRTDFTVVGLAFSPLYLNYERGNSSIGSGAVSYFFLILPEDFSMPAYTDAYLTSSTKNHIFTDAYNKNIERLQSEMDESLSYMANIKYNRLKSLYGNDFELPALSTYVLTRNQNVGYACFENDSKIVLGISVVFPVFFFLVAALVCITTMSRMIEEQRTQIGILKALGYSETTIMAKYMIYSGSAAVLGCVTGFFVGCYAFPAIIWKVYGLMYGFCDISFVFSAPLFFISLAVALICSVGTTYISCKADLFNVSAELIRPKAPKNGKRVFIERITFIWKHLPFLHKVSIRNVFRYKGRFIMMLLGISGCTGLIITGFGIRDSIAKIADDQFTQILVYDEAVNFSDNMSVEELNGFKEEHSGIIKVFMPISKIPVDPVDTGSIRSVDLVTMYSENNWKTIFDLHDEDGKQIDYPKKGEVILSHNVADVCNVETGDTISFRDSDLNMITLKVSGICENYFYSYAYISAETYESSFEKKVPYRSAYVALKESVEPHEAAASFMNGSNVISVNINADTLEMFSKMMQAMNYIVVLVLFCAAALAFIVLYNLTNINITERIREIATIKVLGFYAYETASYVFRENAILTVLGAILGIPVGIWLHGYVMSNIKLDMVTFDVHVNGISYVYSFLFTFAFAVIVDIVMYFKLARINMAESLKSIE